MAPQYADDHNNGRYNAPYRVVEEHVVVPLAELVAKKDGVAEKPGTAGETGVVQPHSHHVADSLCRDDGCYSTNDVSVEKRHNISMVIQEN